MTNQPRPPSSYQPPAEDGSSLPSVACSCTTTSSDDISFDDPRSGLDSDALSDSHAHSLSNSSSDSDPDSVSIYKLRSHSHKHRSLPHSHSRLRFRSAPSRQKSSSCCSGQEEQQQEFGKSDSQPNIANFDTQSSLQLEPRQVDAIPAPVLTTVLVQTVTLVRVVDSSGHLLRTETHSATPNIKVIQVIPTDTAAITSQAQFTASALGTGPEVTINVAPSVLPPSPHLGFSSTPSAIPLLSPTGSGTFSSTPSSIQNSTISAPLNGNSTLSFLTAAKVGSTTTSSRSLKSTSTWTYNPYATITDSAIGIPGGSLGHNDGNPLGSDTSGGGGGVTLSAREKQIVGGVVGSVAGVAFLFALFMMVMKYKKRREGQRQLIGEGGTFGGTLGSKTISTAGFRQGGDVGGGDTVGTGPMVQVKRPSASAVSHAFAALASKKKQPTSPPPSSGIGESGFVRVSGKRLPSVLQHGGDGYSDPHESVATNSIPDYFRTSQAIDTSTANTKWLVLGSPMRPVSGVPIFRSGPARMPVTQNSPWSEKEEQNPFADPPGLLSPGWDAVGRTLSSHDGSVASGLSGSKFHESL